MKTFDSEGLVFLALILTLIKEIMETQIIHRAPIYTSVSKKPVSNKENMGLVEYILFTEKYSNVT